MLRASETKLAVKKNNLNSGERTAVSQVRDRGHTVYLFSQILAAPGRKKTGELSWRGVERVVWRLAQLDEGRQSYYGSRSPALRPRDRGKVKGLVLNKSVILPRETDASLRRKTRTDKTKR